jgi:hypothetical protein
MQFWIPQGWFELLILSGRAEFMLDILTINRYALNGNNDLNDLSVNLSIVRIFNMLKQSNAKNPLFGPPIFPY